jgi:hypothetical protein
VGIAYRAARIDFLAAPTSLTVPIWTMITDNNQDGTNELNFSPSNTIANAMTLTQAGKLSVPSLSVNGTTGVGAGPFTAVTGITTVQGIVTALTGTSDERLKNSAPYEGGLSEITLITPVKYRWNEAGQKHTGFNGEQEFVGFIAQDVQKAIPESITATESSKDGTETYLSLDDRPIIAALVNAVKELLSRIAELEGNKTRE